MFSVFFNLEKRSRSFSKSSAVSFADRTPSMTRRANASFEIEPSKVDGSEVFATSSFCDAFFFFAIGCGLLLPNTRNLRIRRFGGKSNKRRRMRSKADNLSLLTVGFRVSLDAEAFLLFGYVQNSAGIVQCSNKKKIDRGGSLGNECESYGSA